MRIKGYFLPSYIKEALGKSGLLKVGSGPFAARPSVEVERLELTPAALSMIARLLRRRQSELASYPGGNRTGGLRRLAACFAELDSPFRLEALDTLEKICGYSRQMVSLLLDSFAEMVSQGRLDQSEAGLPPIQAATGFTRTPRGYARYYPRLAGLDRFFWPAGLPGERLPRLVGSIAAGNVPGISIIQAFFPVLVGAACLGKNSSDEPYFGTRFLEQLASLESEHGLFPLSDLVCLVTFPASEQALLQELVHQADHLIVTGGHAAKQKLRMLMNRLRLRSRRDLKRRISGHWHKVSFDMVGRQFLSPEWLEKVAFNVAFDNSMFNTQGCLSCQQVFVEGSQEEALAFCEAYMQAMALILEDLPKGWDAHSGLREMYNHYEKIPGVKILTRLSHMGAEPFFAAYEDAPHEFAIFNALNRSILIRRVERLEEDLPRLIEGVPNDLLQSCGIAVPSERLLPIAEILGRAGVNRIVPAGEIWDMLPGVESWDGYFPPYDLAYSQPGYWTTIRFADPASALRAAYQRDQEMLKRYCG
ncbi:MAG: hypothetical protein EHM70_11530 [Chloroflexota bacterium]|nr:MAG: hypothetical protein EHM70_11530 [Chloroflexota bacterium]